MSSPMTASDVPLLIFDGDCGFCTSTVRFLTAHVRRHPATAPWQDLDLHSYGLTADQCRTAVQWVGVNGDLRSAERAVASTLVYGRRGWRLLGWVIDAPGVRLLSGYAYRWVARNRMRLPGATAACAVPALHLPPGSEPPSSL
jgi:predicted DCC family thiol-disulfide oxidoreductase YuxK